MSVGKKFYWLRLHRDFFKRHDVRIIEAMENGTDYVLFLLKLMAESVDHEGRLRFSTAIPYNEAMLATITGTNIDIVRSAVRLFVELGLLERWDDETLYMRIVESMIGSRSDSADRVAAHRARKALHVTNSNVTSISISDSVSEEREKSEKQPNRRVAVTIHNRLNVPMGTARYYSLCEKYGASVVDDAIESRLDWEATKGKPAAKDYASAAANWLRMTKAPARTKPVQIDDIMGRLEGEQHGA